MKKERIILWLFIIAAILDFVSMNPDKIPVKIISYEPTFFFIFFLRNLDTQNVIYFLGAAIAWSLFILAFMFLSKEYFKINVVASGYFGLCLNNVLDELQKNNIVSYPAEYWLLAFTVGMVIYKINLHHHPKHSFKNWFDNIRTDILMWVFRRL